MSASGRHWSVRGEVFTVFGECGYVDGNKWYMSAGDEMVELHPALASDRMRRIVGRARRNGREQRIDYIGVSPFFALRMLLEGVATVDTLKKATETQDRITCEVTFDKVRYVLVISTELNQDMAVYDKCNRAL